MAERYTRLFSLPENLYTSGAPVLIAAGALLKDNQTGKILAQLKFKSLSEKNIKALKVTIAASDVSGNALTGVDEFQYLDLAVERNETFGQKQAIYLPDAVTRSFTAKCTEVVFEDGSVWKAAEDAICNTLPEQETIDDCLKELAAQYQRDTSRLSKYMLVEHEDLWLCTCGAINHHEEAACHRCNYEKAELLEAMDLEGLQIRKADYDREAAEAAEKRAREAAERAEKKAAEDKVRRAKVKKIGIIAAAVVFLIVIATVLTTKVFIPNSQYNDALALMDAGQYAEAITAFEAMDGYKDSKEKIYECKYGSAVALMEASQYNEAITAFKNIAEYRDASAMAEYCAELQEEARLLGLYNKASDLMQQNDYKSAADIYRSIKGYKDSADLYLEAWYNYADQLLEDNKFQQAIAEFSALGDYRDSCKRVEEAKELRVQNIYALIEKGSYTSAMSEYEALGPRSVSPLTEADFVVDDAYSFFGYTNITTALPKLNADFGWYHYNPAVDTSMESAFESARGIHIGDHKIEVLLAYGNGKEGEMRSGSRFYKDIDSSLQSKVLNECDTYVYYTFGDYNLYFYFNDYNRVSFVVFSYDTNMTSVSVSAYGGY